MKNENENNKTSRREFLRMGLLTGGAALAGTGVTKLLGENSESSGEKVKLLTHDGKLVEVDSAQIKKSSSSNTPGTNIRNGVPGKKFVMVFDLARCANKRACVEGCQKMHNVLPPVEWIKVKKMQDSELAAPYWFPQLCYQCDNPPCTKVCPVDATFKRSDGIVAVDNERCIGCKFCMAACPYSARSFNFGNPKQVEFFDKHKEETHKCHAGNASVVGTVYKCDFCPNEGAKGKLPACVKKCPNGVIFYGDEVEDTVTNGEQVFRLTDLLRDRAGYRQFETLGTKPRVYYLPQDKRDFPFEEAKEKHNVEE
ncbi:MAG TPA: 4Fe-4S dicluster domain-containing protein [Bacteroidia bacterium]